MIQSLRQFHKCLEDDLHRSIEIIEMEDNNKHVQGGIQTTETGIRSHASDIYSTIDQEVSMSTFRKVCFRPTNKSSPYIFNVKSPDEYSYVIPKETRLYVKCRVLRDDGANIQAADNVSIVNMFPTSLWKHIDIEVHGKPITWLQNDNAHYKAYLETVLSYGEDARKSHLASYGFCMDTGAHFDAVAPAANGVFANAGFGERALLCQNSRYMEFKTLVHSDFLQSERAFPRNMDFTISFTREADAFSILTNTLIAAEQFKIEIADIRLYVHFVQMHEQIVRQHKILSTKTKAKIFINQTVVKSYSFAPNVLDLGINNMFIGDSLPKSILIGIVRQSSFLGDQNTNPFRFQPFDMRTAYIEYCGVTLPPETYKPNFPDGIYMEMFRDFFDNTGVGSSDFGNCVNKTTFADGMCLMAFDFSPDKCNGFHYHKKVKGTIHLQIFLHAPVAYSVNVIVFGVYNTVATIDEYFNMELEM